MRDAPNGHEPPHEPGPPWDPWARAPAPERPFPPEFPPPAQPESPPQFRLPPEFEPRSRPPTAFQPTDSSGLPGAHQRPAQHRLPQVRRRERSWWYWLLLVAVVVPLLTPLYNRISPELWGLPFFYWCQMAFVVMGASVTGIVQLATRRRRP
jgi:uncharacterized protein DUF3311